MEAIVIESHYLASLEYYALLSKVKAVQIPKHELFKKQTYRNRCYVLGSNGWLPLIIPVNYSRSTRMEEVTIDQNQRWRKDHWGAIYSSYGKAPFFEYFSEEFHRVLHRGHRYLIDLNQELLDLTLKLLQLDVNVTYSEEILEGSKGNYLDLLSPKKSFIDRKIYTPVVYSQLFGVDFSPNLSIVDLLMCEGPNSQQILSASFLSKGG